LIFDFIAQIVGPAAERVDALKRGSVFSRSEPGYHAEILVMRFRQVRTVSERLATRDNFRSAWSKAAQIIGERHEI
jgi:hypothetical protein